MMTSCCCAVRTGALLDWMRGEPKDYDLIQASEKLRRKAHALARAHEAIEKSEDIQRQTAEDRTRDLLVDIGGRERVTTVTPTEAEAKHIAAIRAFDRAEVECLARIELAAQQAEIHETLELPDLGEARGAMEAARNAEREAYDKIKTLESRIALAKAVAQSCSGDFDAAARHYEDVEADVVRHTKQREILNREPTGATADQVAELAAGADTAQRDVRLARKSAALFAEENRAANAKDNQAKAHKEAERYRDIAAAIPQALGWILGEGGALDLTVVDGRLHRIDANGVTHDFETRSSTGERIAAALSVAGGAYKGRVVPLSGELWGALDPEHKQIFVREAQAHGLYVVTEDPSGGELRVEHEEEANA